MFFLEKRSFYRKYPSHPFHHKHPISKMLYPISKIGLKW
jgi:hypothetical protein